jgi:hypothetical protein
VLIPMLMVIGYTVGGMLLSMHYFRCHKLTRPPIGVINLWDVALLLTGIVLVPYLYLYLPAWLVAGLLGLGMSTLLYTMFEPVLGRRSLVLLITLLVICADVYAARRWQFGSPAFFLINNALLVMAVIGFSNLWAQGGMTARSVAILAGGLTMYDFIFTAQLSLMSDLFQRLATMPFAPILAWPIAGTDQWVGLGLGDLIVATLVPLVMRKAYGRNAGETAIAVNMLSIGLVLLLLLAGLRTTFPVMVVLGPLTVLQYLFWRWRRGTERTAQQYIQAEPYTGM